MQMLKKLSLCIMMTLLFFAVIIVCVFMEAQEAENYSGYRSAAVSCYIPVGERQERILWWEENPSHYIVFLPSYVELDSVQISLERGITGTIGEFELKDGMDCSAFRLDTEYVLQLPEQSQISVRFVRSENLPSMYIRTVSGSTETIHTQRNVWEYTEIQLVDTDGALNYYGGLDEISGRGSGSWYYDKKSYNLKLNRPADLLHMGEGRRWILLANALDESHLRNKTVYDFARKIGSYSGFAPDCEYMDVFLNGDYVGLYLMTERVEIADNRVEADPSVILFEVDAISRYERMNLPFILDWGIAAGIKSPKTSTERDRDNLMNRLFEFQDTLCDESKEQEALQYIDLESWSRRYLIDEVFENFDGGCHSQFFFWDPREGHDNRIFAGPCWDYDNCADSWNEAKQNPRCFLVQRIWKNDSEHTPWYGTLMHKEMFRNRVIELYRTELSPLLHQLLESEIVEQAESIETAVRLNATRWHLANPDEAIAHFCSFMSERVDFLDSAWIDGVEYRTVTAKSIGDYRFYCAPTGTVCADIPSPAELGMEKGTIWVREDTGEPFDRHSVIWDDLTIVAASEENRNSAG